MHLGIFSYNATDYGARPDELARACETRGFESLWVGEHTHIPAIRRTPYPGGDPLPRPYYHMADPFVSLMAAAAVTTRLKIGTGVCSVFAFEVPTADQLKRYQDMGVERVVIVSPRRMADTLPFLDWLAAFIPAIH